MKNIIILSVLMLAVLLDVVQGIFLGPVAIGLGLGALLVKKGFIGGALIAGRRSRRSSRGLSYGGYSRRNHYSSNSHNRYTRQPNYYYSSSRSNSYHRGKRSIPEFSTEELHRIRREVDTFDFDNWVLDMSSKDQDDCSKKLICELSAKNSQSRTTDNEKDIAKIFSKALDINSGEVEFNLAAEIGLKKGSKRCQQLYKRCDTSLEDMMQMIEVEMESMREVELQLQGLTQSEIEKQIENEKEELNKKIEEAGIDQERLWS